MTTKTIKLRIKSPVNDSWQELNKALNDLRYQLNKCKNIAVQYYYHFDFLSYENKLRQGEYLNAKDIYKKTIRTAIYEVLTEKHPDISTRNISTAVGDAETRYKIDKKDLISGRITLANFKLKGSFSVSGRDTDLYENNGQFSCRIPIYSKAKTKELERKNGRFTFEVFNPDPSTKTILRRIINGEYKKGTSRITQDRKGKWYIGISYTFENPKVSEPKTGGIMGIDLGINKALYIAFDKSKVRYYIDGGEIEAHRKKVEAKRREMYRATKWAGNGRRGRGYKKRTEPASKTSGKVANFRDTVNHKYSRYVVDMALKHNVSRIQMEDLSGIGNVSAFLKNWSYYDLQEKITYKAKEVGIEVIKIKPDYTSQRCHECGHIDKGNRPNQETFKCSDCGAEHNADYNAAKNIATDGIEEIISGVKVRGKKKQEELSLF